MGYQYNRSRYTALRPIATRPVPMSNLIQNPLANAALQFWQVTVRLDRAMDTPRRGSGVGVWPEMIDTQRQGLCGLAADSEFTQVRDRALSALKVRGLAETAGGASATASV